MKWRLVGLSLLVAVIMWIWIIISASSLSVGSVKHVEARVPALSLLMASPTPTLRSTSSIQSTPTNNKGIDSTLLVALISFISAVVVAFIGVGVAVYQSRRNAKTEKEKIAVQIELERERIRFQDEINAARATQERKRQREEIDAEAALAAMNQAKTITERAQAYRDALHADPRIARLQILDMSHPLDVTNVFVRLQLHQESKPSYEVDQALLMAEAQRDPNELLRLSLLHLESRASNALDPAEAIRKYKRCVIVGDPGAGKTTLLKYLTLKTADKQLAGLPDLPIHIELNAFASSGYHDLLDFASTRWDDRYAFPKADARAYMEENLKAGNGLLLLDALDETVIGDSVDQAEASYKRVAEAVMHVATRYHQSIIVVTARKAGYQQRTRLEGFTELEVLDFRPEDIEQFVHNWFAYSPKQHRHATADDLNTKLARNARLQALAANPLLLSLIVIVYEDQLDLPDRRAELYKRCVDTLLTKWDSSRDILRRREFKPEHKRQLLQEVAWYFHNQGRRYFPENDLLNIIVDFLPVVGLLSEQNIRVLDEIKAENGLLKEQARHWYGFLHLTLQEYFVALYVVDQQELNTLLAHLGDPWWEEVLLLYAGQVPDATLLFQKLLEQDNQAPLQRDIFNMRLVIAGRCLAARPTIRNISLRKEVLSHLFQELTNTSYSLTRRQCAEALAEIGGAEVNTHLVRLLSNAQIEEDLRSTIVSALGELGERSVAADLMRLLNDAQTEKWLRRSIVSVLGELGERSVAADLVRLLSNTQIEEDLRRSIVSALGELGERSVIPDLVRLLNNAQTEEGLRRSIVSALGELGERSVIPDLVRLLSNTQIEEDLRRSILYTLGKLGERSVAADLVRLLSNTQIEEDLRRSIVSALGEWGEQSVAADLVRLLNDAQIEEDLRRSIVSALESLIDDSSLVSALASLLLTSDIADSIHSVLWTVARRMKVKVLVVGDQAGQQIDVIKM